MLDSPVVHIKDIRTKKIVEFPKIQDTESAEIELQITSNDEVVLKTDDHEMDDHETDANNNIVVVNKILKEQQQVVVRIEDTPTIWRSA